MQLMRYVLSCLMTFLTFVFVSCGRHQPQRYVIGVSQCSEDIWREKLKDELRVSTYQHDNVELRFASAQDNDRLQMQQIRKMVDEGVDLLIVSPNQIHTISAVIDSVYDRGIPVILFDRKTDSKKYTAFIGADNVEAGREMARFVAGQLAGKGVVAEISGLKGSSPAIDRSRGFMEVMERQPGITVAVRKDGDWTGESAERAMDDILRAAPHIDYLFGQNDRMAMGARRAAEKMGRKEIRFVGIDALAARGGGLEAVRDGKLDATYIYPTRGDLVMQLAMNILEHKPYRRDNYLKGALVTRYNANVLLMQNEEMVKQHARLNDLHGKVDTYLAQYNTQKVYMVLAGIIIVLLAGLIVYVWRSTITRRKLEDEAMQARLQFFTNVSHELRTPLTLIADPVDYIIADRNLTQQQRDMLQVVRRNVDVLLRLVSELLDFRKVENGKMHLTLTDFDLSASMRQWLDLFALMAEKKHVTLTLKADGPVMMRADHDKVERMCYNLLSNAMKYTPEGGSITFSAVTRGDRVTLSVADTGRGIAEKDLTKVFDRFYQTKGSSVGTGIGLALVKAFAELHHGRAWAESEEGRGATFLIDLPLRQEGEVEQVAAPAERLASTVPETEEGQKPNTGRHLDDLVSAEAKERPEVLIIDDNSDIRTYLRTVLNADYHVSEAVDGQRGLEMARRIVPDIVICDVMMPVMDGLEFCNTLKQDRAISHIPVILLTARNLEEQRAEGYEHGADAYISKPFSLRLLHSRIDNLLRSRRQLHELFASGSGKEEEEVQLPNEVDRTFIGQLRKIIQDRMADSDLSVERIGEEIGLSRVQLYRKVKALTGLSPVEMLRKARLSRARHLLQTSEMSVSEVAYAVGFTTPSYFSKCYKEEFGEKPSLSN